MITLEHWRGLEPAAARRYAAAVAEAVSADGFVLGWAASEGDSPLRVARLDLDGREFVLVPGGKAALGYDAARFEPTRGELASFLFEHDAIRWECLPDDDSPDPWFVPAPVLPGQMELFPVAPWRPGAGDLARLRAHLAERLTPPRSVAVPTLLVAAEAVIAGPDATHDRIVTRLAAAGRRLPTPDEWEYAAGLGCGTLFPWGDRMRIPDHPETISGLRWPVWSGEVELTAVRAEVRGDGGRASSRGYPGFYHALVRAPAFRDPELAAEPHGVREPHYREIIEVPEIEW